MLPDTIKVYSYSGSGFSLVFSNPTRIGRKTVYFAPSPQGDLEGRPTLTVSSERSKSGVIGTNYKIVYPVYANGAYDDYETVSFTQKRKARHPALLSKKLAGCILTGAPTDGNDVVIMESLCEDLANETF